MQQVLKTFKELWRWMPDEERTTAVTLLLSGEKKDPMVQQANKFLADKLSFRPQMIARMPLEKRARLLAGHFRVDGPPMLLEQALVGFHLEHRKDLLQQFLDHLGVENDGGQFEELPEEITDEQLVEASQKVADAFPLEQVCLYLNCLHVQDPEDVWKGLGGVLPGLFEQLPERVESAKAE